MSYFDDKIENIAEVPVKELRRVAREALKAAYEAKPVRPSGCGRAYVSLGYKTIRKNAKAAKVLSEEGFKMFPRPYHKGLHIYVGYDNSTGLELAKAEAIAKAFRDNGIAAGADADGD